MRDEGGKGGEGSEGSEGGKIGKRDEGGKKDEGIAAQLVHGTYYTIVSSNLVSAAIFYMDKVLVFYMIITMPFDDGILRINNVCPYSFIEIGLLAACAHI